MPFQILAPMWGVGESYLSKSFRDLIFWIVHVSRDVWTHRASDEVDKRTADIFRDAAGTHVECIIGTDRFPDSET
jgi:hypothetical protein